MNIWCDNCAHTRCASCKGAPWPPPSGGGGFIMCRYEGLGDHEGWVENVAFASKGAALTCWVPKAEMF
jgi:hypothetical protein